MKKKIYNTTVDLRNIREAVKNNIPSFLFAGLYLSGIIITVVYTLFGEVDFSVLLSDSFMIPVARTTALTYFYNLFLMNLAMLLCVFLLGFSAVGTPGLLSLMFLKGSLCGIFSSGFVISNGLNGLKFLLFVYLPAEVIFSLSLLCAGTQSFFLSCDFYDCMIRKQMLKTEIRTYLKRYILILALFGIGAILLLLCSFLFVRFV